MVIDIIHKPPTSIECVYFFYNIPEKNLYNSAFKRYWIQSNTHKPSKIWSKLTAIKIKLSLFSFSFYNDQYL